MTIVSWRHDMQDTVTFSRCVFVELAAVGGPWNESQSRQFQDFLLRANKYPTLQIFNQDQLHKKIILVEVSVCGLLPLPHRDQILPSPRAMGTPRGRSLVAARSSRRYYYLVILTLVLFIYLIVGKNKVMIGLHSVLHRQVQSLLRGLIVSLRVLNDVQNTKG